MSFEQVLFLLLLLITGCLLYIAYLAWRRRESPVAVSLFLGMCAGAFYSLGYAFEIISSDLQQISFWLRVEYIGISFGTLIWFIMVLQFTSHHALLRKWILLKLAIVPILTFVSHYTNEWHHLFYRNIQLNDLNGLSLVSLTIGPFYMIHVIYSFVLFIVGMAFLIQMYRKATGPMKKQVLVMMVGSCAPYLISIIYLLDFMETPLDLSPFGLLFSGILFIWGIYQFNMMKLVPHALKQVFNSMKDAVIVLDLDNNITSYNFSASQVLKELDKKGIGQTATHILYYYPELLKTITDGDSSPRKIQIANDTDFRYYNVYLSHVCNKRQRIVGKTLWLNDITESVVNEERLLASSKQLAELNAFKDKMFTIVAHDIRDPLSLLMNLMEILREELQESQEKHDEIALEMEQQIQNAFSLVESLLDWFRTQKGGMLFNPVVWNLSQAIRRNVDLQYLQSKRKQITVISEIPSDLIVYADKEILDLIIRNILSNAIKFTDYKGSIEIRAEQIDGKAIVSITDTGIGIPLDQADALLQDRDIYPESLTGTAGERGIGIGLTLCKEFVQINGGELWFESVANQGSTFYFSTPIPNEISADSTKQVEGMSIK
ncbi:histidine kinase N-terminal 7TM domain-containing protein [Paraliobacillus sediminis]|uniref:sensor histidine kinase n=1 Tax=Paraliobacillus sediminis TaxID=1885916 RepID=UPI001F07E5EE|nr:histidine kinase N-terminal 7TM domain-containing protein [Paraliobacillus sediminis]